MRFQRNDGGRDAAGYKGYASDCSVRAIAIATEIPYQEVYNDLFDLNRENNKQGDKSPRNGNTTMKTIRVYLQSKGWVWVPCMKIGSGCKTHLREDELPKGRLVVRVSKHLCAVIDGVLHDTYDCSRDGTRCVYGYYVKAN